MGSPADYTIIVLIVAVGVAIWTLLDRVAQLQRDVEALKRKLDDGDRPPGGDQAEASRRAEEAHSAARE